MILNTTRAGIRGIPLFANPCTTSTGIPFSAFLSYRSSVHGFGAAPAVMVARCPSWIASIRGKEWRRPTTYGLGGTRKAT
eukprot:COSAG02_NODE_2007_length_10128_cov_5.313989_3_plen_80_part_00